MDSNEKVTAAKSAVENVVYEMLLNNMLDEDTMIEYLRELAHRIYLEPEHGYEVER